jgi:hypothetical protein
VAGCSTWKWCERGQCDDERLSGCSNIEWLGSYLDGDEKRTHGAVFLNPHRVNRALRHAALALFLSGWLPGIRERKSESKRPSVLSALIAMGRCRHIKEASHQLRLIVMQLI